MLAQNFLTADELHITEIERDALIRVLGILERGEALDARENDAFAASVNQQNPGIYSKKPTMFYMGSIFLSTECGTACCFLGWARHITNNRYLFHKVANKRDNRPLFDLFFPERWEAITLSDTAKGADALRNYLTFGNAGWDDVVGDIKGAVSLQR